MQMAYDTREQQSGPMWRLETMSKTSLSFIISSGTQKAIMREKIIKRLNAEFLFMIHYSVLFRERRIASQGGEREKHFFSLTFTIRTPKLSSSFWYDEYIYDDFLFYS